VTKDSDIQRLDIFALSPAERILLAERLWDSLAFRPELAPIPPKHFDELNRRTAAEEASKVDTLPWKEVKLQLFPQG
jgi:putative addiction module component (TIGR02574 family)